MPDGAEDADVQIRALPGSALACDGAVEEVQVWQIRAGYAIGARHRLAELVGVAGEMVVLDAFLECGLLAHDLHCPVVGLQEADVRVVDRGELE